MMTAAPDSSHPATHPAGTSAPDPALFAQTLRDWGGQDDLWVFGYGSLIWRPEFAFSEHRPARLHGWHRALKMWSHENRGTPEQPGLVLALLSGGSCRGFAYRVPLVGAAEALQRLWLREMVTVLYVPRFLTLHTPQGPVRALAFTLPRSSPGHTGLLTEAEYRHIFAHAHGRYGSSLDYARQTLAELRRHQIHDRALEKLLRLVDQTAPPTQPADPA